MLVIHGELDHRVPISEALRLWTDLPRHGVEAKFLYFPDENHWVLKPQNARLWYETVLAFLDQHVLGRRWVRPALAVAPAAVPSGPHAGRRRIDPADTAGYHSGDAHGAPPHDRSRPMTDLAGDAALAADAAPAIATDDERYNATPRAARGPERQPRPTSGSASTASRRRSSPAST